MAEATLKKMGEKLESSGKGPEICKKTKAIFCFDLKDVRFEAFDRFLVLSSDVVEYIYYDALST